MRKILLFATSLLMTISMMAAGNNSGTTKANAIDFDWANGNTHESSKALWYRVDMSHLSGMVDPTLALYLTNLTDQTAQVDVTVSATVTLMGQSQTETQNLSYKLNPKDYKIFSKNVKQLLDLNVNYLYLVLKADQKIVLSAKKYETSDIVDEACTKAKDFNWSGVTVPAGETWYRLNLTQVRAQGDELNFVVTNNGSAAAKVNFDLSLDCPASAVFSYKWDIAAGAQMIEEFGRIFIDELNDDYVYLKLTTDQALKLSVEQKPAPPALDETWTVSESLAEGQVYTLAAGEQVFEVELAALKAPRGYKSEFVITNNTSVPANFKKEISFVNPVQSVITKELVVPANGTVTKDVVNNLSSAISSEYAYVRFTTDQELTIKLQYTLVNADIADDKPIEIIPNACDSALVFDWNSSVEHKAFVERWYEFDANIVKQDGNHVIVSFTNTSDNLVILMGNILTDCQSTDTIPYVAPVSAGKTFELVLPYNLFAVSPVEKVLVSALVLPTTATSVTEEIKSVLQLRSLAQIKEYAKNLVAMDNYDASVKLTAVSVSAAQDPTACEQSATITKGVEYQQAPGTQWYRVSEELLNQLTLFPEVTFINKGDKNANIKLAATTSCDYEALAKVPFTVPTWMDLTVTVPRVAGDLLEKIINQDVKEFYLQVTTDQPIIFGLDLGYKNTLGCDGAKVFDWNTGATIDPRNAQWYKFDLETVKQEKKQVKLTFTNLADSIAWVAGAVTRDCPFTLAMPLVFPVPAGASVDKWVDYSFFAASPVSDFYVALYTDSHIQLSAVAESAVVTPTTDCENATLLEPNKKYTIQPGTTWYKLTNAPFANSNDPFIKMTVANKKDTAAHVSLGATVGCEYGILTKAKGLVPAKFSATLKLPTWAFSVMDLFINKDVKQFLFEVTTDKEIEIETEMAVTVYDTITTIVCDGTTDLQVADTVIGLVNKTIQWSKTYPTADPLVDSVVTYIVKPIVAPVLTYDILKSLYKSLPEQFLPGERPMLDIQPVLNYFAQNDNDTIADITTARWQTSVVPCGAAEHTIFLIYDSECGGGRIPVTIPVHQTEIITETATICHGETYTWAVDGKTYDATGSYNHTLAYTQVTTDCDSVVATLNLTVLSEAEYKTAEQVKICHDETYTWDVDGMPYDATGTYYYVISNQLGCDSIVYTLNLEVLPIYEEKAPETVTICKGETYNWDKDGKPYTVAGTYTYLTRNELDCGDVLYTLVLTVNEPTTSEETVVTCDSYTWNGTTYTTSGDYTFTTTNDAGCEHVATLHLTINKSYNLEETETACDSYTWNGTTYTTSGDYTFNGKTVAGCDSIVTLHLTINESSTSEISETACGAYEWNGTTYNQSGDYTFNGKTVAGCDSIVTLHLTIVTSTTEDINEEACESYEWNGTVYTKSGHYVDTTVNADGCEHIAHLYLTIHNPAKYTEKVTACGSYTWNGQTYDQTGVYNYTTTAANGCDSIVTLELTIAEPTSSETTIEVCDSYTWNGTTYNQSGTYTHETKNANGCDSVATLYLTIKTPVYAEETASACESYEWNGETYTASGDYTFSTEGSNGCDSITTLHLTIYTPVNTEFTASACESYVWNDSTYTTSGDYTYVGTTVNGCDSIVTLHLTILPAVVEAEEETEYTCPNSTFTWRNKYLNEPGTYKDTVYNHLGCDSVIYTLHLLHYVTTLPTITEAEIVAICGQPINVEMANIIINDHIDSEELYADDAEITWYVLNGSTFVELTNDAVEGGASHVTLKYSVTTDCGTKDSDPIQVEIQTPNPDNDPEMTDAPALSKYGDRLLLVNLKYIEVYYDWVVDSIDVTWYRVVDGIDEFTAAIPNDEVVGYGYYYNLDNGGPVAAGEYYARIHHKASSAADCEGWLQTEIINCEGAKQAPALMPSVAQPAEDIRIVNLDETAVSTIAVYSTTGEMLDTFQVSNAQEATFKAAQHPGYYIVEILNESGKVSLRYIVK